MLPLGCACYSYSVIVVYINTLHKFYIWKHEQLIKDNLAPKKIGHKNINTNLNKYSYIWK